jgi:TonB family protein
LACDTDSLVTCSTDCLLQTRCRSAVSSAIAEADPGAGNDFAVHQCMRDFAFAGGKPELVPAHKRSALPVAILIHALVAAVLIQVTLKPVRVTSAGSPTQGGIAAFVTGPVAAAAAAPKPREAKTALKTEPAKPADDAQSTAGSAGVVDAGQSASGPVRIGSGGNITLVKKVQPVYPPMMQSAKVIGMVVLDAIIHPDGTIGDVTVLNSTNQAFARSAIDAVKQWKYETIGFEAIVTVTVNFTLT